MGSAARFRREVRAFHDVAQQAAQGDHTPLVPSCPGWSVADLVVHLASTHRSVISIIEGRLPGPPDPSDLSFLDLPADPAGWPDPALAPHTGPIQAGVLDWFADGAAQLADLFEQRSPDEAVWTWSVEQTVGFWSRMQTIEAAVHRWDAGNALGTARPIDADVAVDAIAQMFEVMAPARRTWLRAPAGEGERFRFRRTDGAGDWTVHFEGDLVRLAAGRPDVELAGPVSDLLLFLWQRIPAGHLDVRGDKTLLDRYFALVPPL
ncbi:maleylpyruvate isomerase family mycothiol-dependent enzyme [Nonomuraea sp. NPDC002799]